jgi:hypothetical protein
LGLQVEPLLQRQLQGLHQELRQGVLLLLLLQHQGERHQAVRQGLLQLLLRPGRGSNRGLRCHQWEGPLHQGQGRGWLLGLLLLLLGW